MKALSFGGGVNSTAILALIEKGKLGGIEVAVFADTGAENPQTYAYLDYIKEISPIPIVIVKSKEGSLWDYCEKRKVLPARYMRWCSDRWKKKPLDEFAKRENVTEFVIGIDVGERQRVNRWKSKAGFSFPLITLSLNRQACVEAIKSVGWDVPVKSGCVFCPFAKTKDFAKLKVDNPQEFARIVALEKEAMARLGNKKSEGWFGKYALPELVSRKFPATDEGQVCLFCMEWSA